MDDGRFVAPLMLRSLVGAGVPAIAAGPRRTATSAFTFGTQEAPAPAECDWTALAAHARRHGLSVLLRDAICDRGDVPPAAHEVLRQQAHHAALGALVGTADVRRIAAALAERQVAAVALKGPCYALWLYGDVAARQFGDLDFLVAPADREKALDALEGLGYELPAGMSRRIAAAIYGGLGAWPLRRRGGLPVDLHWRLAHRRFPDPLPATHVIAESSRLELGGVTVRTPSPTHAAVLSLAHAAKHLWATLEMIAGIATLMRRTDVDWRRVQDLAEAAGAWNGFVVGLQLASETYGVPMPAALAMPQPSQITARLRRQALDTLQLPAGVFPDRWTERQVHRDSLDRWTARLRYDASRLLTPTPLEWHWCRLPDGLRSLYGFVRILRLALVGAKDVWLRVRRQPGHAAADEARAGHGLGATRP